MCINIFMAAPNDKRVLPYGGSFSIQDLEIIEYMKSLDLVNSLWDDTVTKRFCNTYIDWIKTTKNNTVTGLENFTFKVYSNGTSQAFDMFFIKNKDKRFRCFKGEYIYHQLAWRNNWSNWKFIEDEDICIGDAVVVSLPFSNTGNRHEQTEWLLEMCSILDVPVLIDCAYFGTTSNIYYNFNYSCITDVTFSLTKTFPVAHARIGIRFSRIDDDDLMLVYDKINYNNRIGAKLGLELIKKFSPDYIYNKYSNQQKILCANLNIIPSNTVLFGLDYNNKYPEYSRGGDINRLGLYRHLYV